MFRRLNSYINCTLTYFFLEMCGTRSSVTREIHAFVILYKYFRALRDTNTLKSELFESEGSIALPFRAASGVRLYISDFKNSGSFFSQPDNGNPLPVRADRFDRVASSHVPAEKPSSGIMRETTMSLSGRE